MKIECEYDPDDLIDQIGNRYFHIIPDEDDCTIEDCECETTIKISSGFGLADAQSTALALLRLLNQEYTYCPPEC